MGTLFKKRDLILISILIPIFIIAVLINLAFGTVEPKITVDAQQITIGGKYGATIDLTRVYNVYTTETGPGKTVKTNGNEFGNVKHGHFDINGTAYELYIFSKTPLYLRIDESKSHYIINFKDSAKTEQLYQDILSNWKH